MSYVANLEHAPVMVLPLARLWQVRRERLCHFPGRPANHGRPLTGGVDALSAPPPTVHIVPLGPMSRPSGALVRPRPQTSMIGSHTRYRYYI